MKVVFRTNVGSVDANALGLDHKKCLAGKSLDVEKDAGDKLIKSGLAVASEDAKNDPVIQSAIGVPDKKDGDEEEPIKAVAKKPEITAPLK